jgi:alkanesulfonate monooxygenase SsuD/methylene tetrahydromethanopterin reductase-like flavin-dependent oxidoreductase (luciferase family)
VCAETDEQAQRLMMSTRLVGRRIRSGIRGPVPTIEEAIRELGEPAEASSARETSEWPRYFAGSPATVRAHLEQLAAALQLDELMIVTIVHDHQARLRSYELLAEAFSLAPS